MLHPVKLTFFVCHSLRALLPCSLILFFSLSHAQSPVSGISEASIIPIPKSLELTEGVFEINERLTICTHDFPPFEFNPFSVFSEVYERKSGYPLKEFTNSKSEITCLHIRHEAGLMKEAYRLQITPSDITITASAAHGVFYAMQTLRQIMKLDAAPDVTDETRYWIVPCVVIEDEPAFTYRGLHLDVCRHFMPLDFVLKYIDVMAYFKFNRFHWHLTEDQGWRIEIKSHPKLQEISAWREQTLVGHYSEEPDVYDGQRHGGYYTHEQIRHVVAYARLRGIEVIPEIEMPGHSLAALAAYPQLACTDGPFKVAETWGVFEDVFCPKEETFSFLEDVLDEVMMLFPYSYIHIGGDESPKTRWKSCPDCQRRIVSEGLADEHELQSYFIRRIEKYLNANGRRIIGWDEILEGGLAPNATVMSWRGTEGGIAAAKAGHDVIMAPGSHCYFDHYQADPATEPIAFGGMTTLEKVYEFNPIQKELSVEERKHILGAQANLWTEYILSPDHALYMAYPRAMALAEVLWSPPSERHFPHFLRRLRTQTDVLEGMQVNFARHHLTD